jgi:branched-chain amino acid transport system ATP-binding protein
MLLQISNLEVCYGVISALQGVSLQIDRGEIVTLIGANGAGKTTLLRTISGLLRPRRGSIIFDGEAIEALPPHEIVARGICHAPEGRQVFANLTVRENLILGAYQEKSRQKITEGLDRSFTLFPVLAERKNQRAGTLSGGE